MTDNIKELVERLGKMDGNLNAMDGWPIFREAASALLSLSGEVERMRGALAPFAAIAVHFDKEFASTPLKDFYVVGVELKRCRNARAALGKDTPDAK